LTLETKVEDQKRLLISFSGGETSAYMTKMLLESEEARRRWPEMLVVFANTGQEREETLEFVQACDRAFGFNVVWIEAVQAGPGVGTRPRVVTFETASRNGEPFEAMIKKYGIPNTRAKFCTRTLKSDPIDYYVRLDRGWALRGYDTAIGIRIDEIDRLSRQAAARRLVYPLISMWPMTKPQINAWWAAQPFRLRLKSYQGNCSWCWKKSFRKHLTLLTESPEIYDFPERMERDYGHIGAEFRKPPERIDPLSDPPPRRTFFRENKSVADLKRMLGERRGAFEMAPDDNIVLPFDPDLDPGAGCEESCEVHADDDEL
jgi:hypothetical protein